MSGEVAIGARPPFPHAIDSTILGTFRSCPRKVFLSYFQHWKPKRDSVHLVAGGAFAKGLEVSRRAFYEDGKPSADAVALGLEALIKHYGPFECPPDSAKSLERTAGALEFYFDQYPLGADGAPPLFLASGKRAIEFSFAEPLAILHPTSGDPLLYCGRSDMIADFAGGEYIFDEKTTSSLGASWSKQWSMRSQFLGYTWARHQLGGSPAGVIVRGVSILKTKYDTQQAIANFSAFEVDRWFHQTCRDIERMKQMWADGYWDFNLDHSCAEYGGCQFIPICKAERPEDWLPLYFEQRVWDPLAREELTVEQYNAQFTKEPANG